MPHLIPAGIELLESRIAPATFISPYAVSYTDNDGDHVLVHISKPVFDHAMSAFVFEADGMGQTLEQLTLPARAAHAAVTISVQDSAVSGQSDGQVNVGEISAKVPLARIAVQGDLTALSLGANGVALGALEVKSMGMIAAAQGASAPVVPLVNVIGRVNEVHVSGNLVDELCLSGPLGQVSIGGSMLGGSIQATSIGHLEVTGDVMGGATAGSGDIGADHGIGRVAIHGSLLGGGGSGSGVISGGLRSLLVGGQIAGGSGDDSGSVFASGNLRDVEVLGSIVGGGGGGSGDISAEGRIGHLRIAGNLLGGSADMGDLEFGVNGTGTILAVRGLGTLEVDGSIEGGMGVLSGAVVSPGRIGRVLVRGDIDGAGAEYSGIFANGGMGQVRVNGSVLGGALTESGVIEGQFGEVQRDDGIGSLFVGGDVVGGAGVNSGSIDAPGAIRVFHIHGSIVGGGGSQSGHLHAANAQRGLVGRNIQGGSAEDGGFLSVDNARLIVIGGSIEGGVAGFRRIHSLTVHGDVIGGAKFDTGLIDANDADRIEVDGSLNAGTGEQSGSIEVTTGRLVHIEGGLVGTRTDYADGQFPSESFSGAVVGDELGALVIDGQITAENLGPSAPITSYAVNFDARVGRLEIGGSVSGAEGNRLGIAAGSLFESHERNGRREGFDAIAIGGSVTQTDITAGFAGSSDNLGDPNAHLGRLIVQGGWSGSSVAAGVSPGADGYFGTSDDLIVEVELGAPAAQVFSRIGEVEIHGVTTATAATDDAFGIEAHRVGSVTINGTVITLPPVQISIGLGPPAQDITVREI